MTERAEWDRRLRDCVDVTNGTMVVDARELRDLVRDQGEMHRMRDLLRLVYDDMHRMRAAEMRLGDDYISVRRERDEARDELERLRRGETTESKR